MTSTIWLVIELDQDSMSNNTVIKLGDNRVKIVRVIDRTKSIYKKQQLGAITDNISDLDNLACYRPRYYADKQLIVPDCEYPDSTEALFFNRQDIKRN